MQNNITVHKKTIRTFLNNINYAENKSNSSKDGCILHIILRLYLLISIILY